MRVSLFCIYLWIPTTAFAHLDADYVQRLSRARSAPEIRHLQSAFTELRIARAACRLQVRQKILPVACYDSLAAEIHWGLHPQTVKQKKLRQDLDQLCVRAAESLRVPRSLPSLRKVSALCRAHLARAQEIQKYRTQQSNWSEF